MKHKTNNPAPAKAEELVCKTISMPKELFEGAENVVKNDPEMNFSKYVRNLIRSDLTKQAA